MTKEQALAGLTDIFRDAFADSGLQLRPEMTAADLPDWDSLRMVNIIVAVETRFGIRLRSREVDGLRSVGDLIDLVAAKA